jgi:enediyne biosynthesis protein E4
LLRGDGKANFKYVPQNESGFNIWGDVRSSIQVNNILYFGIIGGPLGAYKLNDHQK